MNVETKMESQPKSRYWTSGDDPFHAPRVQALLSWSAARANWRPVEIGKTFNCYWPDILEGTGAEGASEHLNAMSQLDEAVAAGVLDTDGNDRYWPSEGTKERYLKQLGGLGRLAVKMRLQPYFLGFH